VIYIVDSDESVKQGLSRLVESAGLEARPCSCVEDLLHHAAEGGVGCALLDLSSRGLSEPALRLRLHAMAATLPIIALSASDDTRTRRMARELGAQAFFRKPVDASALLDSIDWVTRSDKPH
jgi:FixJ family two-component response regulator